MRTVFRQAAAGVLALVRRVLPRRQSDADLDAELRAFTDASVDAKIEQGMSLKAARRAARLELGSPPAVKDWVRDVGTEHVAAGLLRDLRYAVRGLRRSPGFTIATVTSLALGIGANTAIFSVMNAAILRSLPVPVPEELFMVGVQASVPVQQQFTYPVFQRLRDGLAAPSALAAMSRVAGVQGLIEGSNESGRLNVQLVSGEFFPLMGLSPVRGRLLGPHDNETVGGHPVAVISHRLWCTRFGAAPDIAGRAVRLNGTWFSIVGVAPFGFSGVWLEAPTDVWVPLVMQQEVRYSQNYGANNANLSQPWVLQDRIWWLQIIGRTARASQLAAGLNTVFRQELERRAGVIGDRDLRARLLDQRLTLTPIDRGLSNVREGLATPFLLLTAMAALVLLIACANCANLLLARGQARRREVGIRLSIGASRWRLVRQFLTESAVIVAIAASAGLLLARLAGGILARRLLDVDANAPPPTVSLDPAVLGFALLVSIATGLLFGLAPALRTTTMASSGVVGPERQSIGTNARLKGARLLVAAQVAFSVWLVFGSGLFLRSFVNLVRTEVGFEPDRVIAVWLDPSTRRSSGEQQADLNARLLARVDGVPQVESASLAMCGLMSGCRAVTDVRIAGYQPAADERVRVQENRVSADYFRTVGMTLLAGRSFEPRDAGRTPAVAVVNEAMAHRYFGGPTALGQRFGYEIPDIEIVGIVRDARSLSVQEAAVPMAYYPIGPGEPAASLDIRVAGGTGQAIAEVRRALADVDPELARSRVLPLSDQVERTVDQERFLAALTTFFGTLALGLACLGLFGVMSYSVSRRTSEFGVRMALGAMPGRLLWTVARESLKLVALGLVIGLPTALWAAQLLDGLLTGIGPRDAATLLTAAFTVVCAAGLAGLWPAWRASRVDPMAALRHE